MSPSPVLSPELIRQSTALSRALAAAVRAWALYPPEHPAVAGAVARLAEALRVSVAGAAFTFAVTPATLLVAGLPLPAEAPVAEVARLLHDRDVLQLTFMGDVPSQAVDALLRLLARDADALRADGGPAAAWARHGHPAIVLEQIDYERMLEDHDVERQADRRDDVWRSLVNAIVEGRKAFDERQQQRLLEIAADVGQIGELAEAVVEPKRNLDGSPLITTQAATVLAVFRHLTGIVQVLAPDRLSEVLRNVAAATARLDPHLVAQMMLADESMQETPIIERIAAAFDDDTVARLLATALARDGRASARLAQVFDTIASDSERKQRVLHLTRSLLSEHDFGRGGQFTAAWSSMEGLLLNYDESPYVSDEYQASLAGANARAEAMAARELPPELPAWIDTLGQDNVRRLSVLLVTDLLRIEDSAERAAEIAGDLGALCEDLLLAGAFDDADLVLTTLAAAADDARAIAPAACRAAMTNLGGSPALREAAALLGELDDATAGRFAACCRLIGPTATQALVPLLDSERDTPAVSRARELVHAYGAPAIPHLAPLVADERWQVQRIAARLLGATRSAQAVAPLQALLRRGEDRVVSAVLAALAGIDDPSAGRVIQTALRTSNGDGRRMVVDALVATRDPRVVPMLAALLADSDPFGEDHGVVVAILDALRQLADDRTIPAVTAVMRRTRLFARRKATAVKRASVAVLRAVGTDLAAQTLADAGRTGDRLLRRLIAEQP